jgi:hypothetical protein
MHFVVGYTFHEQQRLTADSFGLLPEAASSLNPEDASARPADGGDFEEALKMIADGLEVSARQHAETSPG